MCEYVNGNQCTIQKQNCPFMYYCSKVNAWQPLSSMPKDCNIKENFELPKGYYKVRFERKGKLYVDIDGFTQAIDNPFDDVPPFVKVSKLKNGTYKLRK